jgi:hypothetical protein
MGPNNPDVIVHVLEAKDAELAELRAKLAAAEAHGKQYRKNWKSLQDLTGEGCLDRARYAVKAWKEAAEQLAAAREREAGLLALVERLRGAAELAECYAKVLRYELESRNPETFPGSEDQAEVDGDLAKIAEALSLTPPAALDELRQRERSIGAEEAYADIRKQAEEVKAEGGLRARIAAAIIAECVERADAIAAERKEGE